MFERLFWIPEETTPGRIVADWAANHPYGGNAAYF